MCKCTHTHKHTHTHTHTHIHTEFTCGLCTLTRSLSFRLFFLLRLWMPTAWTGSGFSEVDFPSTKCWNWYHILVNSLNLWMSLSLKSFKNEQVQPCMDLKQVAKKVVLFCFVVCVCVRVCACECVCVCVCLVTRSLQLLMGSHIHGRAQLTEVGLMIRSQVRPPVGVAGEC